MGDHEGWAQPSGLSPNGLLPNETASVTRVLDLERWAIAEERTADLIARIQPNKPSEERRNAVAEYVQRLIMKCFSCQVFTFGSVPLKTYLPDGDIDLTAFSKIQNLKDTWADEVRNILETEEKNENAEFRVKEVQYIQAEVKIIKCLVENIVVDISFNQLGGLCTLCFLEEVDHLINQNHLFKRSIILIKAWCYYESRILGAHHGLISTYALETLVLYIFHVFNNSFAGPLEVLYRFLEFFSNFDWDNFCVSLWGPVPICSLPDMTAEPPRKDSGELFLSKLFLDTCSSVYAVFPGGQENQGQPFVSKYFNVIDPLRTNNNLGRSVSKGNFFRIRSAFAFGAKRLARLLDCPKDNLIAEINQFFMNTWDRHGSGNRPDAPSSDIRRFQLLNSGCKDESNYVKSNSSGKKTSDSSSSHEYEVEGICTDTCGLSSQQDNHPLENKSRTSKLSSGSRTQYQKNCGNTFVSRISDQIARNISSNENAGIEKGKKSSRLDHLVNDITSRYQFARTRSSPELTDTSSEVSSRGRRNMRPETVKSEISTVRAGHSNRRKNLGLGSENSGSQSARSSADDQSSLKQNSSFHSLDSDVDSKSVSNSYHGESVSGTVGEEFASVSEKMEMHQEEQDLVDMMASTRMHSFNGHVQIPMNLASSHLPLSISPSVLNSVGFGQRNLRGMVPTNIPLMEPMWGSNIQFSQTLVSSSLSHYFPGVGVDSNPEAIVEPGNGNLGSTETNQEDGDHGFWREQDIGSARELNSDNGTLQMLQSDDEQPSTSSGFNFLPSSRISSSANPSMRSQQRLMKGNREFIREHDDSFQCQNSRYNEVYSADRISSSRFLPASQHSSSRSRASSESSWDGSSARVSKSTRDKRGRKTTPDVCGKGQSGWQHESVSVDYVFSQADDVASSDVRNHEAHGYEPAHLGASDSVMPISPMLLDPGSQRRTADNPGVVPFAFYPTGPPVPFLTMLPVYNFPSDMDNSNTPTSHFDREHGLDNSHMNQSNQNLESVESIDQSETFSGDSSTKGDTCLDPSEEYKDILTSDFASHWQNLQFGRFCQSPRYNGPVIYPSSVVVPPVYLQGHFPWDGPGRPLSANGNLFSQLMSYGPHLVPVAPIQSGSNRPADLYQRYGNEFPRYRGGTGTYLPNPKVSARDRQSSSTRNQRGNYNYNRNDHHGDREGNWNGNSKPRAAGRSHGRNQAEKPSSRLDRLAASDSRSDNRSDRPWELYRHGSHPSYHTQNGPFISSNSVHSGSTNMAYGMFPLPAVNSNGVSPTGPAVPSVVMLYSYDNNAGYGSTAEHLEFGSVGPVHFTGMNEVSQHGEGGQARGMYEQRRFLGSSTCSSPDQPSSPQFQRGI